MDISAKKLLQGDYEISREFLAFVDTMEENSAILDKEGKIIYINKAWIEFARANDIARDDYGLGANYLEIARNAEGEAAKKAKKAAAGIEAVLAGDVDEFSLEYSAHSPKNKRWFKMRVKTFADDKAVVMHEEITERKEKERQLKYKTFHDELTGLYNRTFFVEEMKRLDTKRQLPFSIIMADINGLKLINDTFGHEKGDEVLENAAEILEDNVRDEDILARIGGDEFVILLPQTGKAEAEEIAARIRKSCQKTHQGDRNKAIGEEPVISLGIGMATKSNTGQAMEDTLNFADERMYEDKRENGLMAKRKMINAFLHRLYAKTFETEAHTLRVTRLAIKLGERLGLDDDSLKYLARLGGLHDIGEMTIEEEIIKKPEKLKEGEFEKIKVHPVKGAALVNSVEEFSSISDIIKSHHERWDGEGYPEGLVGENIPLLARIFSIVDAYDVMTTGRPYQEKISKKEALEEIKECAGTQFDPELAEKFVEIMDS
ncbi:HD-GYP domain-containing protein [Halarsenatibacter silvermanii]|uniref:Diguanylate cyclase (GGDEF) domain-containing protein/HDIG domain-containing protein n=1 Tax=Halarsenatibacter silvermanii TaxID=321763 RepID=A0A1G9R4C8_9FIRM|nr:HD-GYP domain-containing protein [Halarsenatibacter silvermanii]SDM18088.1 diguanylate cyclase (GGDEF) domain-containing protein/HDIG domain-containing protein [Halarsenatibacter silvermanii]